MTVEQSVLAALDASGVPYDVVPCDPALADTAAFCEHYGYPPEESANTIVVASKREPKRYVACVVLATTRLDVNGTVKRRLDAGKVSFASAEETAELTGMQLGGVSALALPSDLPLWVDAEVMKRERIILGGGSRSMKIHVAPEVFSKLPSVEVVDGLAQPVPMT
ncbi:MAG TPA: YbaK/EbsC family protein [Acidimicrobiales bacterium]|nr:YbaK/EbsC family protein [Acidimicrobiales bacterium]